MKPSGFGGCHLFVFGSHPRVLTRFQNVASGTHFFSLWLVLLFVSLTKGIVYGDRDLISHRVRLEWKASASQTPFQPHSLVNYDGKTLLNAKQKPTSGKHFYFALENWPNLKKVPPIPWKNQVSTFNTNKEEQKRKEREKTKSIKREGEKEKEYESLPVKQKDPKINARKEKAKEEGITFYDFLEEERTKTREGKTKGEEINWRKEKTGKENMAKGKRRARSIRPATKLELIDGVYEGVTVKISEKISQEDCRDVIHGLQASLREMSSSLYVATEGRASIGSVTVIIPAHWSSRSCHTQSSTATPVLGSSLESQILVSEPHPLFGDAPWTQQSGSCGTEGDFLSFGVGFLKEANSSAELSMRAGRILSSEWAKYRWGVFSEIGYSGDPLYPPWYLEDNEWTPNLCSDIISRLPPCHPELTHRCPWPPKALTNASSSLLSTPNLPYVSLFCTRRTHNYRAPTKQNVLCNGRSAWEIIASSKDFIGGRNAPGMAPLRPPEISFVKPSPLRFILLVEDSAVMNEQRRWEFVRKAVRRTVVYDLPDESQVAVIVFNSEPNEVAPLSKLESVSDLRERVGSSLPRNPSSVRASQACIHCAITYAVKILQTLEIPENGANIILLTSGEHSRSNEVEEVSTIIEQHGLRLILVLYPFQEYPGRPAPTHALTFIAKTSGGTVFTVMDEGVGTDSKVSMLVALMETLTAAVSKGGATTPVLVHSATYPGGVTPLSTGSFSLDDSLTANAKFSVYYYDLNHVGNTIHLTAPSGSTFASVSMQEEDGDVNMIFVNLHNAERGIWHYKVENRADSHQGLHIQVTSFSNPINDVTIRVWSNQNLDLETTKNNLPIIIYGEVKVNDSPVMGAGVKAMLQRLGTNSTGGTYPPLTVQLLDLGTGEPDITKGDGIYTRFSPPLEGPARYSLTLAVDASNAVIGQAASLAQSKEHDHRHHRHAYYAKESMKKTTPSYPFISSAFSFGLSSSIFSSFYSSYGNQNVRDWNPSGGSTMVPSGCCGSSLQYSHTRQAPPFTRMVTGPTIDSRTVYSQRKDITPPSRISDLMAWVNSSTRRVILEWTAVGNDFDWGFAEKYEGAVTTSIDEASKTCSGEPLPPLPKPLAASYRERVSIELKFNKEKTLYVCLQASDRAGNKGPPSNPAAIWLPHPPTIDQVTVRARGSGFNSYASSGVGEKAAVISGCLGGIFLVFIVVTVYCYCVPAAFKRRFKMRRRDSKTKGDDIKHRNGSERNLINGSSVIIKTSRKSIFTTNTNEPDGKDDRLCNSPYFDSLEKEGKSKKELRNDSEGGSQETLRIAIDENCQYQQNEICPSGQAINDLINSDKKSFSMSIPDVTKVDNNRMDSYKKENITTLQPRFFTLGRRNTYVSSQSSSFFEACQFEFQKEPQPQNFYNTDDHPQTNNKSGGSLTHFATTGPQKGLFRPSASDHQCRQSLHESDISIYESQKGDSATDIFICDDRTSSPPPPAPSGPETNTNGSFRIKRHSVGFP